MADIVHVIECTADPMSAPDQLGQHWVNTVTGSTWLSVGTSTIDDWTLITAIDTIQIETILVGDTIDLDVMPLNTFCAVKYVVCVSDEMNNKWRSFEMLAGKKTSTSVEDSVYAKLGSIIDVEFDFVIDGADVKLVGKNNELANVVVKIHKNAF